MGFFRRLFGGKTPEPQVAIIQEPVVKEAEDGFDKLDTSTRPVDATYLDGMGYAEGVTQPLSPEVVAATGNERLTFGLTTDVGMVRSNNQDAALSFFSTNHSIAKHPDFGLFIVADGMGGHHDGEKASALTARVVGNAVTSDIFIPMLQSNNGGEFTIPIPDVMISAVKRANFEVIRQVPEGGTTVTAVAVVGGLAHVVHVGDSRAYLITKEGLEQITRDHSLVQRLIELDHLTEEEAETHPQKNVLYRALGQTETLEVDTLSKRLPTNSRMLICSDGLWGQVHEHELYEIAMNVSNPQTACDKLVALANTRGGADNITAIILKVA